MPTHPLEFPLSRIDTLICFLERNNWYENHGKFEDSPIPEVLEGELILLTLLLVQEGCASCGSKS